MQALKPEPIYQSEWPPSHAPFQIASINEMAHVYKINVDTYAWMASKLYSYQVCWSKYSKIVACCMLNQWISYAYV